MAHLVQTVKEQTDQVCIFFFYVYAIINEIDMNRHSVMCYLNMQECQCFIFHYSNIDEPNDMTVFKLENRRTKMWKKI